MRKWYSDYMELEIGVAEGIQMILDFGLDISGTYIFSVSECNLIFTVIKKDTHLQVYKFLWKCYVHSVRSGIRMYMVSKVGYKFTRSQKKDLILHAIRSDIRIYMLLEIGFEFTWSRKKNLNLHGVWKRILLYILLEVGFEFTFF